MSETHRLINRICFEQVKPNIKTPHIELEAIDKKKEEIITIEEPKEIEYPDLDRKFCIEEFKLLNQNLAFILENQRTSHSTLLELVKLQQKDNFKGSCLVCINISILIVIFIVFCLSVYGIYMLFNYLK